jgi:hypothetical protein
MSVCILNRAAEMVVHRNPPTNPEAMLKTIAPDREAMVIAVECLFTGYWRADLCAEQGIPCVLGPACSMQAIHGGKAPNDTIAAHTIAVRLRRGRLPQADVSPAPMRATKGWRWAAP